MERCVSCSYSRPITFGRAGLTRRVRNNPPRTVRSAGMNMDALSDPLNSRAVNSRNRSRRNFWRKLRSSAEEGDPETTEGVVKDEEGFAFEDVPDTLEDVFENATDVKDVDFFKVALLFLFPALGGLLFGFDIGATSGALVSLTTAATSGTEWGVSLSSFEEGLIVSLSLLGALAGSVGALFVGDKLGRKKELILAAVLYCVGAAITSGAPAFVPLTVGRFLYGLGIGFAMHSAPAYIAETSPSKFRGFLISLKEAFIVAGILSGYLVSYLFIDATAGWRVMYGVSLPVALLLGIGMFALPESPRWLVLSGQGVDETRKALEQTKGNIDNLDKAVDQELNAMLETAASEQTDGVDFSNLLKKRNVRPLYVGLSLMFFQQITGQPSVLYYAARIFQDAGFAGEQAATGVSVILGFFKLIMTSIAALFVDSWGRRPFLLLGVGGLTASLLVLGLAQAVLSGGAHGWIVWVNVIALLTYVGCYQMSFGPISWLMCGEIFPLDVRGQAVALATFVNFGTNFVVSLVLPSIQSTIGLGNTYFTFCALGVAALFSIYYTVPETKGKTLEEIEASWLAEEAAE